jgi:hypothetical protein
MNEEVDAEEQVVPYERQARGESTGFVTGPGSSVVP